MTVNRYTGDRFTGLSSDTKPTNATDGSTFHELDTNFLYQYYTGQWHSIGIKWEFLNGSPTDFRSYEDFLNTAVSSGITSGCDITDNGDGTVDISSGHALIRSGVGDRESDLYSITVTAQAGITLTDNSINHIYIDWNGGSPQFNVTTSDSGFNCIDKCLAYVVHREGTVLDILDAREQNIDTDARLRSRLFETDKFTRAGNGSKIGYTDRYISLTAGKFYFMLIPIEHLAFDTSVAGTDVQNVFEAYYRDGVGGWNTLQDQKQIDNAQYDDGSGTLVSLPNNRWAVHWVYLVLDDDPTLEVVYSQESFVSLSRALDASPPEAIPDRLNEMAAFVGRVIIQEGSTTIHSVESAFEAAFGFSSVTTHNNLAGLQGGALNEYYHLDGTDYTRATTFLDGGSLTHTGIESSLNNKLEDITNESIGDLQDVLIATPSVDDVLFYDAGGDWVNRAITEADISDLGPYDNYVSWALWVDGALQDDITSDEEFNLAAGTNITLSYSSTNNTVTIDSAGDTNQNAFANVAVSGQTTVAADTPTDTLTLAEGSNVTITTDAGTDTITISSTDTNTQLSEEEVQDFAWNVLTGTQTLITITYDDLNNNVDFVVNDDLSLYDNTTSGFLDTVDLGVSAAASTVDITNTGGTDATIPAATTSLAGVLTASDKTKLDGIETGAEVNQNTFSNVAVSGQTTVAADAKTDTLTLVAGTNVSITTDAGTDSITINAPDTTLSEEEVQDFAWNVLTGTQTLITVTYDDANNNVDFTVNDDLSLYDNSTSAFLTDVSFTDIQAGSVLTSAETFSDVDDQIMTAAAIDDLILSKGYTTNTGDITAVTAGVGLSGGGTNGSVSLAVDLSELTDMTATMIGTDEFIVLDAGEDRRKAANEINLSIFNDDLVYDNYQSWALWVDGSLQDDVTTGEEVNFVGGTNVSLSYSATNNTITIDATDTNTQLSEEQVQDFAWNVLTGTQTLINVTYDDGNNNVDFVVNDDLSLYDNTTSAFLSDANLAGAAGIYDIPYQEEQDVGEFALIARSSANNRGNYAVDLQLSGSPTDLAIGFASALVGGEANAASGNYAGVLGGNDNGASGDRATVLGGNLNEAQGSQSSVVAGVGNTIQVDGQGSVIVGGGTNVLSERYSGILAGVSNSVSSEFSAILSGSGNSIAIGSDYSIILGGETNTISGANGYGLAAGRRSKVNHQGTFIMSDSQNADHNSTQTDEMRLRFQNGVHVSDDFSAGGTVSSNGTALLVPVVGSSSSTTVTVNDTNYVAGETVFATSSSAQTYTLGSAPTGFQMIVIKNGTGDVNFSAGSGQTVVSTAGSTPSITTQHAAITLIKRTSTEWTVIGNIE